ncbi:MAG: GMC family oxidoreductase [Deltaproteobacteria bacterium]|nr:GMC family oxidoreductase [Deltaproteobacteria bacterium]
MSALIPLPVSPRPHVGVKDMAGSGAALRERCDVVVVGSGPAGAVAAKELAEAGRDVVLLEEGRPWGRHDFVLDPGEALQRTVREGGTRAARGSAWLPTMQAIGLGGGSLINSAICARPPAWVFDRWAQRCGTRSVTLDALVPHFERVETQLEVQPTDERVQGERNLRFKRGCDALGLASEPTWRNASGCLGSAECFTGCRNGAKRSLDVTYVPAAIRAGARVYCSVRAERVVAEGRRARALRGHIVRPPLGEPCGEVEIEARAVVLAAGCMASPIILARSGLGGRSGWLGRDLQFHPGLAMMALFPERIDPWTGATQGYHSLSYLDQGLKLEVLWAPPGVLAARLPGIGHDYQHELRRYAHLAPFDVIAACERSRGTVRPRGGSWDPEIRFELHPQDFALLQRGLGILADICWAAGAEAILPGLHGIPEMLRSPSEAEILRTRRLRPADAIMAANHAFGTTRMSREPGQGVVDELGRCHDMDNVYVADTGIFSGSSAVNPMLTCMALADRVAGAVGASL